MNTKSDLLNGNVPHIGGPQFSDAQIACIDLLKEALAEALEGRVSGIGIVLCLEGGWASVMAGTRPGDLNLGCDDLKRKILSAVTEGEKPRQKANNILRARV